MDSYRDFPSEFELAADTAEPQDSSIAPIGTDERRMHVRAYNYWVSLLDGRDYPSIEDLEPGDLVDFAPHSVLLDFTSGEEPATPYVGVAIREECDIVDEVRTIGDVPSRSLLSRLTDHYMQIIANRAPVGFEAEFENQRGDNLCYRGILMPFSSDGDTIDFIYGVINWKKVEPDGDERPAQVAATAELQPEVDEEEPLELTQALAVEANAASDEQALDDDSELIGLDENAGLADRLWAARESAEAVKAADGRSRQALYRALARAYDFALASLAEPDDYAELLDDSGVKAQARAPMTPIVKLVFGIEYDKARLTEFAAALSYGERQGVEFGGFLAFIEAQAGGLKALVAAERQARRPEPRPDTRTEQARQRLRSARALSLDEIRSEDEFALMLTRRSDDGNHRAVAILDDPALVERAIRKAGA